MMMTISFLDMIIIIFVINVVPRLNSDYYHHQHQERTTTTTKRKIKCRKRKFCQRLILFYFIDKNRSFQTFFLFHYIKIYVFFFEWYKKNC